MRAVRGLDMSQLETLRAKLAARKNVAGYEKNCELLEAEIARHEAAVIHPFDDQKKGSKK